MAPFTVPKPHLSDVPYFSFLFDGSSCQAHYGKLLFQEAEPGVLEILSEWLNSHKLRGIVGDEFSDGIRYERIWNQPKLYALATKLGLPDFANEIMNMWYFSNFGYSRRGML
jgi:hypothetical protein